MAAKEAVRGYCDILYHDQKKKTAVYKLAIALVHLQLVFISRTEKGL